MAPAVSHILRVISWPATSITFTSSAMNVEMRSWNWTRGGGSATSSSPVQQGRGWGPGLGAGAGAKGGAADLVMNISHEETGLAHSQGSYHNDLER